GWSDLVTTLRSILDFEREGAPVVELNVHELDARINPNDHPDHLVTARVALEAGKGLSAQIVHHVGYAKSQLPRNLNLRRTVMQAAVFTATVVGAYRMGFHIVWYRYLKYLGKSYIRIGDNFHHER